MLNNNVDMSVYYKCQIYIQPVLHTVIFNQGVCIQIIKFYIICETM